MSKAKKVELTPTEKKLQIGNAKDAALAAKKEVSRLARTGKLLSSTLTSEVRELVKTHTAAIAAVALKRKDAFKAHTVLVQEADKKLLAAQRHLLKVSPPKSTSIMR